MDVIAAVKAFLEAKKPKVKDVKAVSSPTDHGTDIIVTFQGSLEMEIEAKVQTSSKSTTARFGKEFASNHKEDHLGLALLKACQTISKSRLAGIALPDDKKDKELILSIEKALKMLGVVVFLVSKDKSVTIEIGELPF